MSKKILGTLIHGIGSCQNIDSSGEIIEIAGIDTSSAERDAVLNWEHSATNATQVIGKVLLCKKILKKEDCENEHHKYFWDKVECPFLYVKSILFDGYGHSGAKDAVAMLKFDQDLDKENTRQVSGFSIEGSCLGKEGNRITKCIMRKMSFTNTPCQKQCIAEILEDDKPIEITAKQLLAAFKKSEEIETDLAKADYNKTLSFKLKDKPKKVDTYKPITPATGEHREGTEIKPTAVSTPDKAPEKQKIGQRTEYGKKKMRTGYQIYHDPETWKSESNSIRKQILKSMSSSNIQTRMMLSERKEEMRKDILKSMADDAFEHFEKKEEIVAFVADKYPEMSKVEVLAFAKTFAFVQMKKSEMDMIKMAGEIDDMEKAEDTYHIHEGKNRITSKPLTLKEINEKHGSTKKLESTGFRIVPAKDKKTDIAKGRCWDGYEPTPGNKAFSEGSCKPVKKKVENLKLDLKKPLEKTSKIDKPRQNKNIEDKRGKEKGVHETRADYGNAGQSKAGLHSATARRAKDMKTNGSKEVESYHKQSAKQLHQENLSEIKKLPKPDLPKSEASDNEIHLKKNEDGTAELTWGENVKESQVAKIIASELSDYDELDDMEKGEKPFHGYNKEKHSKTGGMSDSAREKYNKENGSDLKRPVTGDVKAGSKAAKRRKSFCARMSGNRGPTSKDGKLTPKGAALKKWRCN